MRLGLTRIEGLKFLQFLHVNTGPRSDPGSFERILVPRGRAPVGQHQESRPLARSNDIPVLNGFVNRGRMIELSTEMARVAEVDRGNFVG